MATEKPFVVWLTGLPCSGKTTIARELSKLLHRQEIMNVLLDGDELRSTVSRDLGFDEHDRMKQMSRAAEICRLMLRQGVVPVCSFVSPLASGRELAREVICSDGYSYDPFVLVHVTTPVEVCIERDVKGMYKASRLETSVHVGGFTGFNGTYHVPLGLDTIRVDTIGRTPVQAAATVLAGLAGRGLVSCLPGVG